MAGEKANVVVAMSGGVDSSVAAYLLKEQGVSAIGVSMQVWDYRNHGGSKSRATCCSPDDFTDARKVAAKVGIPYYVFDLEETFRREVIDKFVESYRHGATPNPCVECNRKVKFKELRNRATSMGYETVATGHYARITKDENGYHLLRGVDSDKDQSYFLYALTQEELSKTIFPVGHLTKPEVREIAKTAGLVTAEKPESQDICFVSGSTQEFLVRIGGKTAGGDIVLQNGQVVGKHDGIHNFTVGQRKGIGVGGTEAPLYVLELIPDSNRVIVGAKAELEREDFMVEEISWASPLISSKLSENRGCITAVAQLRHRHPGVPVEINVRSDGYGHVRFVSAWSTVSPGQACVFYDEKNVELLGGGTISRSKNNDAMAA